MNPLLSPCPQPSPGCVYKLHTCPKRLQTSQCSSHADTVASTSPPFTEVCSRFRTLWRKKTRTTDLHSLRKKLDRPLLHLYFIKNLLFHQSSLCTGLWKPITSFPGNLTIFLPATQISEDPSPVSQLWEASVGHVSLKDSHPIWTLISPLSVPPWYSVHIGFYCFSCFIHLISSKSGTASSALWLPSLPAHGFDNYCYFGHYFPILTILLISYYFDNYCYCYYS